MNPVLGKFRWTLPIGSVLVLSLSAGMAFAEDGPVGSLVPAWINPFRFDDPAIASKPMPMSEIGNWIDHVGEKIRDDGIVALKQPDIFSQARLTKYRKDFEDQMSAELTKFNFVLSARVARLDAATTTSTTSLGAALGPPGSTNVTAPTPAAPTFGPGASLDLSKTPFANLTVGQGTGNIGLEPTVFLDEKKRFLDHLNEIRRVSIGPDQSDSAGYGLYLMRLPVSITPGECTYQGYGADLAVTVEHAFSNSFLPSTIRNLVVNDLVDQLAPVVYEIIRNGTLKKIKALEDQQTDLTNQKAEIEKTRPKRLEQLARLFADEFVKQVAPTVRNNVRDNAQLREKAARRSAPSQRDGLLPEAIQLVQPQDYSFAAGIESDFVDEKSAFFARFFIRQPEANKTLSFEPDDPRVLDAVANRLDALIQALVLIQNAKPSIKDNLQRMIDDLRSRISRIQAGDSTAYTGTVLRARVQAAMGLLLANILCAPADNQSQKLDNIQIYYYSSILINLFMSLYDSALPDDVNILDDATGAPQDLRQRTTVPFAQAKVDLVKINQQLPKLKRSIFQEVSRNLPSTRNPKQSYPIAPREVPDFFFRDNVILLAKDAKQAMITNTPRATDVRSYLRQSLYVAFDAMSKPVEEASEPPLLDQALMDQILMAIRGRRFGEDKDVQTSPLRNLHNILMANLQQSQSNITGRSIGALCWAVAVDTVLLDAAIREDVHKVLSEKGHSCPDISDIRFYIPTTPEVHTTFQEYVRLKWPILTFALDPVFDQQNIADSSNMKRDLQLALSFAFATGQINFNQANSFRRQIEQQSDTIALNRTVSAYAHGENMFGYRFTPRYQNPPNQRTNFGVIASQLIGGGPGPDYGLKKSKLEPGLRELTAVLLVPSFLQNVRMETAGNWFRLNDPEHLVIPTRRMLEQSRKVQELKQGVALACNAQNYRPGDLRSLEAKIQHLDAMLPLQTRVVSLPFENTATGFELFSEGETAMVPELAGFEGVDVVQPDGGAAVFVFGKYFSIHETKVIVGGLGLQPSSTNTPGEFDIISREVLQVRIPAKPLATVTVDGLPYLEIHVATPAGISNRVLVPVQPKSTAPPQLAYNLSPDTNALKVDYQWLNPNDGTPAKLVASTAPSPDPIKITWDDGTGIAASTLRVKFDVTFDATRTLSITLKANGKGLNDYEIDAKQFVACLLARINQAQLLTAPALLPGSVNATVSVRPEEEGHYRIKGSYKKLDNPLTINFANTITGTDALKDTNCPETSGDPDKIPADSPANPANQASDIAYSFVDDSKAMDVDYQWLPADNGKSKTLVASNDPGAKPLKITWDDSTGIAPKALRVKFELKLDKRKTLTLILRGNAGAADDYQVDRRQLVACVLEEASKGQLVVAPNLLPDEVKVAVSVRPESGAYRIKTEFKPLDDALVIKFHNVTTGKDVLKEMGVKCEPLPEDPPAHLPKKQSTSVLAPATGGSGTIRVGRLSSFPGRDVAVRPAALRQTDPVQAAAEFERAVAARVVAAQPALTQAERGAAARVLASQTLTDVERAAVARVLAGQALAESERAAVNRVPAGQPLSDAERATVARLLGLQPDGTGGSTLPLLPPGLSTSPGTSPISGSAAALDLAAAQAAKALNATGLPAAIQPIVVTPPAPNVIVVAPQQAAVPRKKRQHVLSRLFGAGTSMGQSAANALTPGR